MIARRKHQVFYELLIAIAVFSGSVKSLICAETRPQVPNLNGIHPRASVSQYVDLLPADSESLLVINQKYRIPASIEDGTDYEPLAEFCLSGLLSCCDRKQLGGSEFSLCIAGARRFRSRDGLGLIAFEGAQIFVFRDGERAVDRIRIAINQSDSSQLAHGYHVATFSSEVSNTGASSVHVAELANNVFVSANSKGFLIELLSRTRLKNKKTVAFPASLVEWNGVPAQSGIWGIRHYRQRSEEFTGDPTSPFETIPTDLIGEAKPIGFAASLDYKQKKVTVNHWSRGRKSEQVARQLWAAGLPKGDVGVATASPGVTTVTIKLSGKVAAPEDSAILFTVLMMLGYGMSV